MMVKLIPKSSLVFEVINMIAEKNLLLLGLIVTLLSCKEGLSVPSKTIKASSNIDPVNINCPTGFIGIRGNGVLGTADFCVMQFEAKADAGGFPESKPLGFPWVSINATNSQIACESMSEAGFAGVFTLVSNPEWMTIARDIELVEKNWSGGFVGSGQIPRGHSDADGSGALQVSDVDDPYDGTGNNAGQAAGSGWEQKRTHTLSSGDVIWDLSANVNEWTDWVGSDVGYTASPTGCTDLGGSNGTNDFNEGIMGCSDGSGADSFFPTGNYTSAQSFGGWFGGGGGAAFRGGYSDFGVYSGIFGVELYLPITTSFASIGFRCVYRP